MTLLAIFTKQSQDRSEENNPAMTLLDWRVFAATCTLVNLHSGEEIRITPRGMEVLMHLIRHPETVVSANELLELFWSKSVRSDHAVHNVIAELRGALGDQASNPRYIKTYPKRGYALIAPALGAPAQEEEKEQNPARPPGSFAFGLRVRAALLGGALALGLVAALINSDLFDASPPQSSGQRMLLVQPFENINVESSDLYLSRQLPGSLVSRLSKIPNAQIVVNQGNIRADTADYLLNGSIQQVNDQHRVQVNLTDAHSKVILFSDQFNFSSEEIFNIQDQIVQHVVIALRVILDEDLRNEMQDWGTSSALAYDAFLKGEFYANSSNHASFRQAIDNFLFAIAQDPDFENAYLGLANIATKNGLYSLSETGNEMRQQVNFALRELLRINPYSQSAKAAQILALRVEGNNQPIIEQAITNMVLDGNPPNFAISHYASLLTSGQLFREASDFLSLIPDETPYRVSPDATWTYRDQIAKPQDLIAVKKQQLLEKPRHLGILGSLARSYAFLGEREQANAYLAQQLEVDEEGPSSMLSQVIISALYGSSIPAGDRLEAMNRNNPEFNFVFGVKAFILGDVNEGIQRWQHLNALDIRRLFSWLSHSVIFFPDAVLEDARYQALLDELGIGRDWQHRLMEDLIQMSEVTGITLSEESRTALASGQIFTRNNLWDHASVCYLCARNPVTSLSPMERNTY
ncbi:MAG: winged helix-turn-helix domain-containing protein [Gammaproteobacteria bacterium]|nr:winged helix-turn-helix domain-containing protein [Pseudomonadales bacterium]MCP5329524.1 winged helix-turn-helix domain-containing protein [Pseudomonadales bacterium]